MLVKVNSLGTQTVKVTQLDIDDYGSVISIAELELELPQDDSVIETLKSASYAAVFTQDDDIHRTITLAKPLSLEDLNEEKKKCVETASNKRK